MKRYVSIPLIFAVISLSLIISSVAQIHTLNDAEKPEYLFVLSGNSGKVQGDTLVLNGVPNVVYFSGRPSRVAGHRTLSDFVSLWNKSSNSFKADPPNATLSIMDSESAENVVLELMTVEAKDNSVSFKVRVLKGEPPKSFANAALFIDEFNFGPNPGDG